ncbi:MAG: metallophosphoesterase [Armatimonadota bacterium]|nr:metallophosphoesterase [Armatimonadota bacterium]MDR7420868.1 metallophosphoesterase [Armatimonadota bacterium]MDR7453678.1 metallophosphoesterase [Armatimonadota bacterium]MDR7495565.1 metallophosphoesterase [Armatimonadota bacterium]MDR7510734.1 metallophosphoesterase [Armatimonadota bacterium]
MTRSARARLRPASHHIALAALLLSALLAPRPGDGAPTAGERVRAVVFGDFNGPYGSTTYSPAVARVVRTIVDAWRPDIVLSAGDMIAGQKADLPDARFPEMWRAFDAAVAAPLRRAGIPFAFALGNHDASAARSAGGAYLFQRERDHAAAYWRDPAHRPRLDYASARDFPFAYGFLFKKVFFLVIDASSHVVQNHAWVQAALESAPARAAPMRVVLGHLPLYGVSMGRSKAGEVIEGGEGWRARFEARGVDLYISGHHAAYYPAHRGRLRLLHSGGVGARRYVGHPHVPSRSTVTLLDIDPRVRAVAFVTYDVDTGARVELAELPACLDGYNGPVFRFDLPQAAGCAPGP